MRLLPGLIALMLAVAACRTAPEPQTARTLNESGLEEVTIVALGME